MRFYASEELSQHRSFSPEGFLICTDVPIARTGVQVYAANELPNIEPNQDGIISVDREPEEVFDPNAIASFNGKPVCNDHPPVMVGPETFRQYSVGVVINPRQGDGIRTDPQRLYADLLIQEQEAIQNVLDGKVEVSAGYDAEYEQLTPGRARLRQVIGNHVALVSKGRCGPHCAIGDAAPEEIATTCKKRTTDMAVNKLTVDGFRRILRRAGVRTRDEGTILNAVSEVAKDPELLGEIVSDAEELGGMSGEGHSGSHHVTINVHGGKPEVKSDDGPEMGEEKKELPAAGGASPKPEGEGGGGIEQTLQAIMSRLERVEKAVMMLSHEDVEEGGGEEEEADPYAESGDEKGLENEESEWENANPGSVEKGGDRAMDRRMKDRRMKDYGPSVPGMPSVSGKNENGSGATTDRRRARVGDSASIQAEFTEMLSRGEMLCPGVSLPTFDSAARALDTREQMCIFRRHVLNQAYRTKDGKDFIDTVTGGGLNRKMTCDNATMLFNAASGLANKANKVALQPKIGFNGGMNNGTGRSATPADINARNRAFYNQH